MTNEEIKLYNKNQWNKYKDKVNTKRRELRITPLHTVIKECNDIYWSKRILIQKARKNRPWMKHLNAARYRCNNPNCKSYKIYGGRGIKCFLDRFNILQLWLRDCAYKLKQPSLDRINSDGHYTLENCRFIEWKENSRLGLIKILQNNCKPILQYDLQGNFVNEFESISLAGRITKINFKNISLVLNNWHKSAGGYVWKYKYPPQASLQQK